MPQSRRAAGCPPSGPGRQFGSDRKGTNLTELLGHVGGVIAPVLICVLIGYGLALIKTPFDNKVIGGLVADVGYPALILSHLAGKHIEVGAFVEMLGAALACVAAFGVIGAIFLMAVGLPRRAFLSPMMLNNVGNIGLPVAALAFGPGT